MATAIVSPSARPRPSTAAETMPERPKGSTAVRIISQRVAPRASAASSWSTRGLQEDLAADRGHDRQHHDGEHDAGGEDRAAGARDGPGEEREPADVVDEPGVDRLHGRGEHADAPEAEHHRGHRGEQVDDVAEHRGQPARRVVRDEQGDADRDRHGHDAARARRPRWCRRASGPTYAQKFSGRIEASSWSAKKAGMLCTIRKIATAARVTRIMDPANTAEPEKTRSPGRCFALIGGGCGAHLA